MVISKNVKRHSFLTNFKGAVEMLYRICALLSDTNLYNCYNKAAMDKYNIKIVRSLVKTCINQFNVKQGNSTESTDRCGNRSHESYHNSKNQMWKINY